MTLLTEVLGEEVYIAGNDIDSFSPISVFTEKILFKFKKKISEIKVETPETLIAAYGILTSAVSLPDNIPNSTEIFLIIPEANSDKSSFIITVESLYLLQKIIETMVGSSTDGDDLEDVVDYVVNIEEQKIENIFILYGHSLDLMYHIPDNAFKTLTVERTHLCLKKLVEYQDEHRA